MSKDMYFLLVVMLGVTVLGGAIAGLGRLVGVGVYHFRRWRWERNHPDEWRV